METLRNVSLLGLLSIALTFTPLIMAVMYVVRPNERRLALMRPLSLAGLFAALTGAMLGFINTLVYVTNEGFNAETSRIATIGFAESLVTMLVGFACLTVAWLLVAAGMTRQSD